MKRKKIRIGPLEKEILIAAKNNGGTITAKEARIKIKRVQDRYNKVKANSQARGYSGPTHMPISTTFNRMEKKGLLVSTGNGPRSMRKGSRIWHLKK